MRSRRSPFRRPRGASSGDGDFGLRLALSAVFTMLFTAMAAGLAVCASRARPGDALDTGSAVALAALCGVMALLASTDLWTAAHRRNRP
jgi:hypothetical protein